MTSHSVWIQFAAVQQAANLIQVAKEFKKSRTEVVTIMLDTEKAYDEFRRNG